MKPNESRAKVSDWVCIEINAHVSLDCCKLCYVQVRCDVLKWETSQDTTGIMNMNTYQGKLQMQLLFCNGGGFLSVKDAFSETGYPAFYR